MTGHVALSVSSEGAKVAEAELADPDPAALVAEARARGADLLWVHTDVDLASHGFTRYPGYVRMRATAPAGAQPLRPLSSVDYALTLDRSYRGLWGHKHVRPDASPPAAADVVGLYEGGEAIGLCIVFTGARLVDGPGLVPEARAVENYVRLLSGACAALGPGPVDLDSWGDPPEVIDAYRSLGFDVVECSGGWELRLSEA